MERQGLLPNILQALLTAYRLDISTSIYLSAMLINSEDVRDLLGSKQESTHFTSPDTKKVIWNNSMFQRVITRVEINSMNDMVEAIYNNNRLEVELKLGKKHLHF